MSRTLKAILTLCLALLPTSLAVAQAQPKPIIGVGTMLFHPDIQKELKLSDEQLSKLKDVLGKVMVKYDDVLAKFQKAPPTPEEAEKLSKALTEDSQKAIAGVLDAKQVKRFKQILWQSIGITSLLDPEVQKELKLSDEQTKKLTEIFKESGKKWLEMVKKPEPEEKFKALIKELEDQATGVLTEEQQKSYKELKGPKFELSPPPPPPPPKKQ